MITDRDVVSYLSVVNENIDDFYRAYLEYSGYSTSGSLDDALVGMDGSREGRVEIYPGRLLRVLNSLFSYEDEEGEWSKSLQVPVRMVGTPMLERYKVALHNRFATLRRRASLWIKEAENES